MEDPVDAAVGFVITVKPGDWVETGEPLASVYARDRTGIERGRGTLRKAITIGDEAEPPLPLISHRVTKQGVEALA
jgi:pyrimidine-nucleoside phosphorylase